MEQKFEEVYKEILKLNIDELELLRKKCKKEMNKPWITLFTAMALGVILELLMYILYNKYMISESFYSLIYIILYVIILITMSSKISEDTKYEKCEEYRSAFKRIIIKHLVHGINKELNYNPDKGINAEDYRIIETREFNVYNSDDLIQGNISNISIELAGVVAEDSASYIDSKNNDIKVFEGLFAKIEFPREFNTKIYIRSKIKYENKLKNYKVELDSKEYNKVFWTYSLDKDKVKVSQILTQDLIEVLLEFKNRTNINIDITIKNNCMYIRFHTGIIKKQTDMSRRLMTSSLFEPPEKNMEILDKKNLYENYKILHDCFCLINQILNEVKI